MGPEAGRTCAPAPPELGERLARVSRRGCHAAVPPPELCAARRHFDRKVSRAARSDDLLGELAAEGLERRRVPRGLAGRALSPSGRRRPRGSPRCGSGRPSRSEAARRGDVRRGESRRPARTRGRRRSRSARRLPASLPHCRRYRSQVERVDVRVPLVAALRHHLAHDAADPVRERRLVAARVGQRLDEMHRHDDGAGRPRVGRVPGQEVVERRAERVDVGAGIDVPLSPDLLGRDVMRRSDRLARLRERPGPRRDAWRCRGPRASRRPGS